MSAYAFWLAAAALVGTAWAMLWPAVRRQPKSTASTSGGEFVGPGNVQILKEQLVALEAEFAAGRLDSEQHRSARTEIERRVLEEDLQAHSSARPSTRAASTPRTTVLMLALGIPALAFGLYGVLGNQEALKSPVDESAAATNVSPEAIEAMLAEIEKRLLSRPTQPEDLKGWTLLARSYASMQQFAPARRAYDRAIALAPEDAALLADQADVIAMLQGQQTAGEPARLIDKALRLDPNNMKALALAGTAAIERRDFPAAIALWTRARAQAEPGSDFATGLDRSLAQARKAVGDVPGSAPMTVAEAADTPVNIGPAREAASAPVRTADAPVQSTQATEQLTGRVGIAPTLAARVAPSDTVFIFARAAEGPRMPLAIVRRSASELPIQFRLDDSLSMSPQMKLSKFPKVIVVARVSRSGSALPESGDLQGQTTAISPGTGELEITIDSVQP